MFEPTFSSNFVLFVDFSKFQVQNLEKSLNMNYDINEETIFYVAVYVNKTILVLSYKFVKQCTFAYFMHVEKVWSNVMVLHLSCVLYLKCPGLTKKS